MAKWRRRADYRSPDDDRVYSYPFFCGECGLEIAEGYSTYERHIDVELEARHSSPIKYCCHCGAKLEELSKEDIKNIPIEKIRPVNHYDGHAGRHRLDRHIIKDDGVKHSPDPLCYCRPDVRIGDYCLIIHRVRTRTWGFWKWRKMQESEVRELMRRQTYLEAGAGEIPIRSLVVLRRIIWEHSKRPDDITLKCRPVLWDEV